MPDLTSEEVQVQLAAIGLTPLDAEDLAEITHRINAVHDALQALEFPDLDAQEPVTIFGQEEARS